MIKPSDIVAITKESAFYPTEWLSLPDAPERIYAIGDISLLRTRKFVVVGARRTPIHALKTGGEIVKTLALSFTIVTGVADGADVVAIESGLERGKVICVLAGGFSAIPQGNYALLERVAKQGLLLALHPYDTVARAFFYEYRNKFLAALGETALVLGAGEKSGALITAKYVKKQNKKVFALPYSPGVDAGVGCNALIKDGAYLTEKAEDVYLALGMEIPQTKKVDLTATESVVVAALHTLGVAHVTAIAEETGIPVYKLQSVLSALEVKGAAVNVGGNRYSPV